MLSFWQTTASGAKRSAVLSRSQPVTAGQVNAVSQFSIGGVRILATPGTPEYWGDTKTQTLSVFARIKESLDKLGLGFGDVVAMTVYLAGDPAKGGRMDFDGMMAAYSQFFGTKEQPNLPARSTVQVAGLVGPGMLVEIEVQLAK